MSYIGRGLQSGAFRQLDDISSGFDGSDTTHTMQVNSTNVTVGDVNQILLSLGGVIQKPGTDFTVSSSTLTFTTAPAANTSFFAILLGSDNGGTVTPTDGSVTTAKIVDDAVTAAKVASSGAFAIGAAGTASSLAGIPFFQGDTGSIYTHDVSGTDSTAQYNTAYGITALDAITTGDYNIAIGYNAGTANTTGNHNTIVGATAAQANTEGTSLVAIGPNALQTSDTETHNLAIGRDSMNVANSGGEYNVAVGNYTLDALTSGDNNVAIGYGAGTDMTTAGQNVIVGSYGGYNLTTGSSQRNIMIGYAAGFYMADETNNVGIGALSCGGTGTPNGSEFNVGVGSRAIEDITTADACTAVGYVAGANVTTGAENTFFGYDAGSSTITGSNNICVGSSAKASASNESFAICIGNSITAAGNDFSFGKASNVVTNDFDIDANWTRSSDVRKKRNIHSQGLGLDFINDLRTVRFQWKPSNEFPKEWNDYSEENNMNLDAIMHGFIAQEVKEALDKHASDDDKKFSGWKEGEDGMQHTSREMFVIPLIKAVQELSAQVEELKEKLKEA